ncbi:MAG TPA: gliding motility-associated ABC transporter permease subunit GldF [Algoriphagus sp.]|jgi:ABC-2 type transport system permease protein|uniref:gliding motility-associated ABC transporter permease subunit GldF n=1 Tax=unclassified Algoriphagus TaxID=2641541 RepID=UPI000C50B28E|nr:MULTISPECIES: gliding motility-associated ABC transporter permease subunit GldF [unclassified Algoriphagus]MAL14401.1 gliding motility-associated ABC transporter permease subunit GldF [Algoriphagus sp.]MAN87210.1 gliding motility-associated ABC transporter permease subunit GldF [Algoriphagus sp.]QYH40948.1 gliding motility-associated ABC transporter permease subunit GldF [Algoriphagus sp. NBT04N3]HAD50327.1 gliding motility-associated ABC transporter permease subunit GldF [Algoriphagus sp.]|tara:strand:- start:5808 stop:6527 length:720 start_codon:yes stop_codon:yes gene_type:complete
MKSLFIKEINAFFGSLLGYLILALFLVAIGLIVWVFPETSVLEYGYADLEPLFTYTPYVFTFLIPALSMRAIAEEKRNQTWELLRTAPLSLTQIIIAKYLALLCLIILAVLPTLLYYISIVQLGDPIGNLDQAGFFGSWIGLLMIGAVFGAVGIFASALTSQQVVAFVLGVFLCFLIYFGFTAIADLQLGAISYWIEEISLSYHYVNLSRGVIDSSDLFFLAGMIWLFLGASILVLKNK